MLAIDTKQKAVHEVQLAGDEGMHDCLQRVSVQESAYFANITQMESGLTADDVDV